MFRKQWNVLLVDDEPDVLAVSKLALKGMTVYGVPVKVFEAKSKAEAIKFLQEDPEAMHLAAALVDVVMESDTAGFEVCTYLRESHRTSTQIIVRTGQPGKAPEREVVDKYDISGYLSKVDATDQRLYSVLKTAIRQYFTSSMQFAQGVALRRLAAAAHSRATFLKTQKEMLGSLCRDFKGRVVPSMDPTTAWISGDAYVGAGTWESPEAGRKVRDRLRDAKAISFGADKLHVADDACMVSIAGTDSEPAMDVLWTISTDPMLLPAGAHGSIVAFQKAVRSLWALASNR